MFKNKFIIFIILITALLLISVDSAEESLLSATNVGGLDDSSSFKTLIINFYF